MQLQQLGQVQVSNMSQINAMNAMTFSIIEVVVRSLEIRKRFFTVLSVTIQVTQLIDTIKNIDILPITNSKAEMEATLT